MNTLKKVTETYRTLFDLVFDKNFMYLFCDRSHASSDKLGVSGSVFTVAAFIFAALFAMATGSGFGTISTMSFILFPAGILLGANPAVLGGAIPNGVAGMFNVSILLMVVVSMGNLMIASGCMERVVNWLNESVIKSERGAELSLFCLSTVFGILIAAINTIANICVAPFVNAIGKKNGLHPYRRANILATTICSFPFFLPYGGCVLLFLGGVSSMMDTYTFLPKLGAGDMMFTAFYSWAIWFEMLTCCITGIGRSFEGPNGEEIKSKKRPQ